MPAVSELKCVVAATIEGQRIVAAALSARCGRAEKLAPRVGSLKADAGSRPQGHLRLQRVVVGVAGVGLQGGIVELRIGLDEILRDAIEPEHGAVDT